MMLRSASLFAAACLAAASALATPLSAAPQWTEPGGGPLNQWGTDAVEAPRTIPQEIWKTDLGEILSEPVISNGVLYIIAKEKRSAQLLSIDLASGETKDKSNVAYADFAEILVFESTLIVATAKAIASYEILAKGLKKAKTIRGKFTPGTALMTGVVAGHDEGKLTFFDLRTGKDLVAFEAWNTKPVIINRKEGGGEATVVTIDNTDRHHFARVVAKGLGTRNPVLTAKRLGEVNGKISGRGPHRVIQGLTEGDLDRISYCNSRIPIDGTKEREFFVCRSSVSAWDLDSTQPPVVYGDTIYLRKKDRTLVAYATADLEEVTIGEDRDGDAVKAFIERDRDILSGDKMPEESRDGPMTRAKSVLLLGNYAVDVDAERVLWVAPDLTFDGRLIPAADGVIVYAQGGTLYCAGDDRVANPADLAEARAITNATAPGSGDAAILMDGRRVPGSVEVDDEGVVTVESDGQSQTFPEDEVAILETEGTLEVVGHTYGVVLAWQDLLDQELREALVPVYEELVRRRLVEEARTLLTEIESLGAPSDKIRAFESQLSGKKQAKGSNAKIQRKAVADTEAAVRKAAHERRIAAAQWLAEQDLSREGSALLADWKKAFGATAPNKVVPGAETAIEAAVKEWIQPEFESKDAQDWLDWMRELSPAGARFGALKEVHDRVEEDTYWYSGCMLVKTDNIELLTTCEDQALVGACLSFGEAAIRTLNRILDNPQDYDDPPLDVRLHASRKDYLNEDLGDGSTAPTWTAGFYSPSWKASRFYAPTAEEAASKKDRDLQQIVAHELTHQYIAERWRVLTDGEESTPKTRGFWVVEGFARFIEDQSVEMGRRGMRIDDHTVQSVEAASVLLEKDKLIDMKLLIDMNQIAFGALSKENNIPVETKSTLGSFLMSQTSVFYEQSGALVFFLMHRAGPEVRAKFIKHLENYYLGKTKKHGWKALGYDTVEELEEAYFKFLRNPASQ